MTKPKSATAVEITIQPDQERVVLKLYDENERLFGYAKLTIEGALQLAGRATLGVERLREANTVEASYRRVQ